MIQQVVHTARWVPGAWRGWLRYQTAHTRGEVGKNISSAHRKKEKKETEEEMHKREKRPVIISIFHHVFFVLLKQKLKLTQRLPSECFQEPYVMSFRHWGS